MDRKAQKRKEITRRSRKSPKLALCVVSIVAALAVVGVGVGLASADKSPESSLEFGLSLSASSTASVGQLASDTKQANSAQDVPQSTVSFNVDKAADSIDAAQTAQREKELAEERAAEEACRAKALEAESEWLAKSDRPTDLEEVDWSVSKAEFVATWGERINAFLEGSNLAGYGETFAEAAWENGIDPRFSAAICNTESGRAAQCFRSYNAWGWGQINWSSWDEAIREHAKGLAEGYGYGLTLSGAYKYCWDTYTEWYALTLYGFEKI